MQQQHKDFSFSHPTNQQLKISKDNCLQFKRKLTKRLSNIHQRFSEPTNLNISDFKKQMDKNVQQKTKILRKDTLETKQTLTDSNEGAIRFPQEQKINQLIQKSQNDPFLKRKLQSKLQNDLKNLMKLNKKNYSTGNLLRYSDILSYKTNDKLNCSQKIENEYKNLPKDISIILNDTVLRIRSDPLKSKAQKLQNPLSEQRIFQDFTQEQQKTFLQNQRALKQQYTTLRKQNYKDKVSRIESLRLVQQKQKAITAFALGKFLGFKKTEQSFGHIRRNSQFHNKFEKNSK